MNIFLNNYNCTVIFLNIKRVIIIIIIGILIIVNITIIIISTIIIILKQCKTQIHGFAFGMTSQSVHKRMLGNTRQTVVCHHAYVCLS